MKLSATAAIIALIACSCNFSAKQPAVKSGITKDTLQYQYQTFKQRAEDCGSKPDSACTVVKIKYPVFKHQAALNDSVRLRLAAFFPLEKADTSWKVQTEKFMSAYKADKAGSANSDRPGMFYTLESEAVVVRQDSSLTTIQVDGYSYTGGAHGGEFTSFINWNTSEHKNISLDDVLKPDYWAPLNAVAEKLFRKQENLKPDASLKENYFFNDGKFSLNHNYLITPVGIRFLYNQYEIKPYAAGQTDLLIPYHNIKSLLKPGTVVSQYIKH
ncbi:DUF3298 and DUF4163 domain-containing protein [Mucilaginibacter sp. RS28]|uniref:DUF3298 and DUF4163 domain-containing protein n=1 Tax=Mucilaginibacter straminoryzae TaxID=2932774 RepID=A0A9X1X337_9SPHI|nr:DUF3298 and DUF4163 domain-containing protein [Mucilaginibacter straminoryzae]MCJ8209495.1 DUF3298 and DUF4163 domain-containing protein [Mucilaginibacter straminoryzae]